MGKIDRPLGPALGYDPASVGMREVARLDDLGGGYDWATMAVWRDLAGGGLYYLAGSGCSCNSLCDGVATLSQLDRIDLNQAGRFSEAVHTFVAEQNQYATRFVRDQIVEFLSDAADAMADELLGVDPEPDPGDVPADPDLEAAQLDRYHRWCARLGVDPSDVDVWDSFVEASYA